ncbi:TetR family transcriptional regulator [Alkalispirillum mobile]|uniref:TetR family transcriptional regulator n=1 Tax=Alkalispirillum mobile TaxID=85925 RepID=A0A498C2T4_9GAMM|nr:TetR family transcriptional regulator [Alkalispirillum mobile]RLK50364.1 TetR family transcriptional regulator [Alkalispirillum mobile]
MRKTKAEAERTRHQLLDAAEAVFLDRGVANTSLAAIAEAAGMTRGAIYWHFRDKTDLYNQMVRRVKLPLEAMRAAYDGELDGDPVAVLEELCLAAIRHLLNDDHARRVYTIVLHRRERRPGEPREPAEQQNREEAEAVFLSCFQSAEQQGRLQPGLTPERALDALIAFMTGLLYLWLQDPDRLDMQREAECLVRVCLRGLVKPSTGNE